MGNLSAIAFNKEEKLTRVFCYGTLKKGFGNHRLLTTSLYHGTHTTLPHHKMVSLGGFPGVIYNGGSTAIKGEVYEVDNKVLETLDRLEGYPSFYDKEAIMTMYGLATMYVLSDGFVKGMVKHQPEIETGEWQ